MRILCAIFIYCHLLSGCTLSDPGVPEGSGSYEKGGIPKAAIRVVEQQRRQVILQAVVESTGGRPLTDLRLCYSETNTLPDTTDQVVDVMSQYDLQLDNQQLVLAGLEPATGYYCRLFLANSDYSAYSNSAALNTKTASAKNTWQEMALLPSTYWLTGLALAVGERAFVLSSYNEWNYEPGGELLEYLPDTDSWVHRSSDPVKERSVGRGITIGNKMYIGLGFLFHVLEDGSNYRTALTDWWCYDPSANTWERKSDIPANTTDQIAIFSIRGKGYVVTSAASWNSAPVEVWEYDPALDRWSRKRDFSGKKVYQPGYFTIGDRAYLFAGMTNDLEEGGGWNMTSYMWEYEAENDSWSRRSDFGGGTRAWMAATASDSLGYAGFGAIQVSEFQSVDVTDLWSYNPSTDKWSQLSVLDGWAFMVPRMAFCLRGLPYIIDAHTGRFWKYIGENE